MSYYYRNRRRTPFKVVNDNRPKRFDVRNYLKDEFFNCDKIVFTKIANLYGRLYGTNAYNYMIKTFYSWKSGSVGISGQTFSRILQCVPRFLSDEKRFYILKCEMVYFLDSLHYEQQSKNKTALLIDINNLFLNYLKQVENFDKDNLSWFVGKGIFSDYELDQFIMVCRYSLLKRLNLSVQQVYNDLTLINEKISYYNINKFESNYKIDFLNTVVDISSIKEANLTLPIFDDVTINLDGLFEDYAQHYILDELMKVDYSKKAGDANAFIKANDLNNLLSHYNQQLNAKKHFTIESRLQGQGGVLTLNLAYTPLNITIEKITIASIKIIGLLACESIFLYFWFGLKSMWGFILGFYGGCFLFYRVIKEIININKSINQYKKNG
jgi:hypothetical protein